MNWIETSERLPQENKKYPVVIQKDDKTTNLSFCSFNTRKNKFHFDMHNISWKVIKWFDLPEYEN